MRVHEDGALGHLHFGGALAPDRSLAHLGPAGFAGFSNRVGDPVALEYPTTGSGDHRVPALTVELADGSTVLDLRYVEHRIVARQAGTRGCRRPPRHLRRVGRRGRHARDRPRRRAERPPGRARVHDLRRPAGHRPERHDPERRRRHGPADRRDEPRPRPSRRGLGVAPAQRRLGPRDPRHRPAAATRSPVGRQRPRIVGPPAQPVHRPPSPDDDRGRRRGLRLQPRLLGQPPRRGRGRHVRHRPRSRRDQPEHLQLDGSSRATRSRRPRQSWPIRTPVSVR